MKIQLTLILYGALTTFGCSTVKTLNPKDDRVHIEYHGQKTYCEGIPRVYSGFSYTICQLRTEPSKDSNLGGNINGVPVVVIDSVCSLAADTLALPYTLVRQINEGSLGVD